MYQVYLRIFSTLLAKPLDIATATVLLLLRFPPLALLLRWVSCRVALSR